MTSKRIVLCIICLPFFVDGFGIEIEGLIDLGPKWNYEYKFSPISYQDTTVKTDYSSKYFDISQILRTDNVFQNEKQRKIKTNSASLLENHSNEKYKTYEYSKRAHKFTKIHDSDTNDNNDQSKIKYRSTQITLQIQLSDENYLKKSKTKFAKDLTHNKKSESVLGISDFEKNKHFQKNHKSKKRDRLHKNIIDGDHKVKDDPKIFGFTLHIFNENLKVIDNLMKKVQLDTLKRKIKSLKKSYIEEFKKFLLKNKNYKIKTRLGNQKVILNTINTSDKILQRLIHQLAESADDENFVANPIKILKHDIDRQKVLENIHACKKLGVCRITEVYSEFLTEIIGLIIKADDSKVKQAAEALTEVANTSDLTNVIDTYYQNELQKIIKNVKVSDPHLIRAMFLIVTNAIRDKNNPIVIMNPVDEKLAPKTIAFHNLIDILDKNIVKANSTEWDQIKSQFNEWKDGLRVDILNLFENLIRQIITVLNKMDSETVQHVNENIKILLSP